MLLMYAAGRAGASPATTNKAGYRPTGGAAAGVIAPTLLGQRTIRLPWTV